MMKNAVMVFPTGVVNLVVILQYLAVSFQVKGCHKMILLYRILRGEMCCG